MKNKNFLMIDGYNIIHAWDELKRNVENSIDICRIELIEIMSNYSGYIGNEEIIIVFDAHKLKGNYGTYEKHGNIHVIYTRELQTADQYIESFVATNAKNSTIEVATSDVLEQIIILGRGATKISANQLHARVFAAKKEINEKYLDAKPIKNNMLFDNLDPETAKWLDALRYKKGR